MRFWGRIPKYEVALQSRLVLHVPQFILDEFYLGSQWNYGFIF
jgi:hypothetical protein